MSSDIIKKKYERAKAKKVIDDIREGIIRNILETGNKFIVTVDNIPIMQDTAGVVLEVLFKTKKRSDNER